MARQKNTEPKEKNKKLRETGVVLVSFGTHGAEIADLAEAQGITPAALIRNAVQAAYGIDLSDVTAGGDRVTPAVEKALREAGLKP